MKSRSFKNRHPIHKHVFPAHWAGVGAAVGAVIAAFFDVQLAAVPLSIFLILCFTAPFLPRFGFFLPVVSRGTADKKAVAITFDDGPDPSSTPELLQLLAKHRATATFYVNGRRAEKHPHLIRKTVSMGHTIGNHTYRHDNFIMLKSSAALKQEILKTQQVLRRLNVIPLTFRPPVGITSPKLYNVLRQLELYTVNFSRRAGDRGNRQIKHLSKKILHHLRPGDIIMLHDIAPQKDAQKRHWLAEVDRILTGINKQRLAIIPLSELIERPVMKEAESAGIINCTRRKSNGTPSE